MLPTLISATRNSRRTIASALCASFTSSSAAQMAKSSVFDKLGGRDNVKVAVEKVRVRGRLVCRGAALQRKGSFAYLVYGSSPRMISAF